MGSTKENNCEFIIRVTSTRNNGGVAKDAEILRELIQELADAQKMPDEPKLNADQLHTFLNDGATNALIAIANKNEDDKTVVVAGYAIYYIAPSMRFGKVFFLEDLYIRPNFRHQKLGTRFMSEMTTIASALSCDTLQWNVLANNTNAIQFYTAIRAQNITMLEGGGPGMLCWRIEPAEYEAIIRNSKDFSPHIKFSVTSLKTEDENCAEDMMQAWRSLAPGAPYEMSCTQKRYFSLFDVVQAHRVTDGTMLGMALFHRCAFSTWTGPYMTIDNVRVGAEHRHQGIGMRMVAEIAKLALESKCPRIGWTLRENDFLPFVKALGAINLTEKEGWMLFQQPIIVF